MGSIKVPHHSKKLFNDIDLLVYPSRRNVILLPKVTRFQRAWHCLLHDKFVQCSKLLDGLQCNSLIVCRCRFVDTSDERTWNAAFTCSLELYNSTFVGFSYFAKPQQNWVFYCRPSNSSNRRFQYWSCANTWFDCLINRGEKNRTTAAATVLSIFQEQTMCTKESNTEWRIESPNIKGELFFVESNKPNYMSLHVI